MKRTAGYTLTELLIVVAVLALIALLVMPPILRARRDSEFTSAIRTIRAVILAEAEFQTNDVDGNGKADFWTRDVRGLAHFRNRGSGAGLIDDRLAKADGAHSGVRPIHGHYFQMLEQDEEGSPLANSAGVGPRFLFCMVPAYYPEFDLTWVMDQDSEWWRLDNGGKAVRGWMRHPGTQWARFCRS